MAFVVTRDTVAAIELDISARELGHLTDFGRMTMQRPDSGGASLWRAPLRRLHQHLVQPIVNRGFLHDVRKLIIVPHAELHFLPFSALLEPGPKGSFLVERFDISYAPSATAWLRLSERKPPTGNRKVLALAPNPDRLPGSADEVAAIREVFGRRTTVLTGAAATERALREAAPDYRIIHLATFGVLNRHNPLFSHIELAREPRDGGRFEVHEVYGLELNGQLVVLSACQTALASGAVADVPIGDDWIGLVQAFLEAGASDVLAAQWPVEDRATARLMHHFYRALAQGLPESAALAAAQRAMLRNAAGAHPFYWAGFVLNGASR
jgi:CHAT domain-containing protein